MATRGGKRPGTGGVKGKKTQKVLDREESLRQFRERVQAATHHLLNAQMGIAVGSQYLFKTVKGKEDPIMVRDPDEMMAFLRGDFEDSKDEYYFMTSKDPDNRALDSLFNRTWGKATDNIDIKSGGEPIGAIQYIIPKESDGE